MDKSGGTEETRQETCPPASLPDSAEDIAANPPQTPRKLLEYRATIDNIDAALVHLLAERFRCTQKVGRLKAHLDLPAADPQREAQQVERLNALAVSSGLDPTFAKKFMRFIVQEVIRHHEDTRLALQQQLVEPD